MTLGCANGLDWIGLDRIGSDRILSRRQLTILRSSVPAKPSSRLDDDTEAASPLPLLRASSIAPCPTQREEEINVAILRERSLGDNYIRHPPFNRNNFPLAIR